MDDNSRMLIESLYCNCSKLSDAALLNDFLALKSFADSVGGEVHTSERNRKLYDFLKPYVDYLPYGKYQLRFSGAAKLFIDSLIEQMPRIEDVNVKIKHSKCLTKINDEYFICKRCCPICSGSQRGCPLHCCTTCWKHLNIMSRIRKLPLQRVQLGKKRQEALMKSLNDMIKNDNLLKYLLANRTTGYLHSVYDIVKFMYLSYEYNLDSIKILIKALSGVQ